jgi:hypothetical protein
MRWCRRKIHQLGNLAPGAGLSQGLGWRGNGGAMTDEPNPTPQEGFARRLMFQRCDIRLKTGHGGFGVDEIPEEQARRIVEYARMNGFLPPAPSPAPPERK